MLDDDRGYDVRLRAVLDDEQFPGPLRLLAFWRRDWSIASDWYRWPIAKRIRSAFLALLAVFGILLWLVALLSFTRVTENSDDFAQLQNWILLINSVGIACCSSLIVSNSWQLDSRLSPSRARLAAARAHGVRCS